MSKARFSNLKRPVAVLEEPTKADPVIVLEKRTPGRVGKKCVAGYYSPLLARRLNMLAAAEDSTVQALLGEALDLLMRARGEHPFGER